MCLLNFSNRAAYLIVTEKDVASEGSDNQSNFRSLEKATSN